MSSSRRTGTNEHIETYGGASRNYTSLSTWESIYDVDLTNCWKVGISNLSGTFTQDEALSFAPSGATGTYVHADNGGTYMVFVKTGGTPAVNDTITGGASGKTATLTGITYNNGISAVLECYNDATFNDYVTLAGTTTTSSFFRIIRPAAGQGHNGTPTIGVSFYNTTDAVVFLVQESYTQIQDIVAKNIPATTGGRNTFNVTSDYAGFIGCIAFNGVSTGLISGFNVGNSALVVDCLSHNNTNVGFATQGFVASKTPTLYNCTSTNNGTYGFRFTGNQATVTHYVTNCIASGNTTADFSSGTTGGTVLVTYCASGDATSDDFGTTTGDRVTQTFTFINSGGDDFHLASNDAGAKDYGTDLSTDAIYPFNDDIDKHTRPCGTAWDIGFDEVIYSQTCTETLTTAESKINSITKRPTDSLTISDLRSMTMTGRILSEILTSTDSIMKAFGLSKSETLITSDSKWFSSSIKKTETITFTDALTKIANIIKSENATFADYCAASLSGQSLSKSLVEYIYFTVYQGLSQNLSETLSFVDSLRKAITIVKSENIIIPDYLSKSSAISKTDTLNMTDYQYKTPIRVPSETLTFLESTRKAETHNIIETLTFLDNLLKLYATTKSDSLTISDSVLGQLVSYTIKTLAETITLAETTRKAIGANKAESLGITDSTLKSLSRIFADAVALADSVSKSYGMTRVDTFQISDSKVFSIIKQMSEALQVIDNLSKTLIGGGPISYTLNLSERLAIADAYRRIINLGNLLVNVFAGIMTDDISDHFDIDRIITDDISNKFGSNFA